MARDHAPDLILLDIGLPDLSGVQVAAMLRKMAETSTIPIVAVTGYSAEDQILTMRSAGCDDVLVKPIETADLVHRIRPFLPGTQNTKKPRPS